MEEKKKVLLSIQNLTVKFRVRGRILTAIRDVSLDIYENESIAIVGESGSGKSVLTKTFAGMTDSNGFVDKGKIIFDDPELAETYVKLTPGARSLMKGTLSRLDKMSRYELGADSLKVFLTVTLPLIKDSFLSGLVTAFVRSITAISAIILLVTPQFLLITVQINEFAEKGSYGIACAFATILIIITYGSVLLMNLVMKFFGTSRKLKEEN